MKAFLAELRDVPPGKMFAWVSAALVGLSIVVIGDKLDGMAAAMAAGVGIGALAGVGAALVAAVFLDQGGYSDGDESIPAEVLEAIDDLRIYVTTATLLGAEIDEPTERAMLTVWAWLDQAKGVKG